MAAPVGNKFWEMRSSHGRKPIFKTPEDVWVASCEYFNWCYETPLLETKAFAYEGMVTLEELPKMRAMTIQGLCFFLDISDETWSNYCEKEDFIGICNDIKRVIFTQKFEGASAGLLNASIITRELGLADKKETTIDGKVQVDLMSELIDEISE